MRKQIDPEDSAFRASLPPDLRELDRELSALRIEERQSFGPELEGELIRGAREVPLRRPNPWVRTLLAACLGGIMIAGVAVPSARGSVARLVKTVLEETAPGLFAPSAEPTLPGIQVSEPPDDPSSTARTALSPLVLDGSEGEEEVSQGEPSLMPEVEYSLPELLHRQEAEAIIASFYPTALQRAGVGGTVDLVIWVDSLGVPDLVQFKKSSGTSSLDRAAMRAAYELRFRPAQRAGTPVGTWVEFAVHFVPPEGGVPEDSDSASTERERNP
jgi:protein TonB